MSEEEAKLYLEHTSKDDFNLEEHQKENRYQAIQVVLEEIERLNNIINRIEEYLEKGDFRCPDDLYVSACDDVLDKLKKS